MRELPAGERPADWLQGDAGSSASGSAAPARVDGASTSGAAPARVAPRYKVQFTASQEHVDLLERARDLLSHAVPDRSIEEVHLRALRELVAALEKKKYAPTDKPRQRSPAKPRERHRIRTIMSTISSC